MEQLGKQKVHASGKDPDVLLFFLPAHSGSVVRPAEGMIRMFKKSSVAMGGSAASVLIKFD